MIGVSNKRNAAPCRAGGGECEADVLDGGSLIVSRSGGYKWVCKEKKF